MSVVGGAITSTDPRRARASRWPAAPSRSPRCSSCASTSPRSSRPRRWNGSGGCHPAPADDALRKSLAAKEASEAANRAAWTGQDGTAIEGVEPVGPDEELRRNPLAYSDSDSDDGDVDERRPDRPTLVPSARRSLRPFLRPRGARDSDARDEAKENGRLVVGWPFHRDVYDPRSDSHRVGPSFGGGFSPCADKARGVQRQTTSNDPDASKLAEFATWASSPPSRGHHAAHEPDGEKGRTTASFWTTSRRLTPRRSPLTRRRRPGWKSHEEWTAFAAGPAADEAGVSEPEGRARSEGERRQGGAPGTTRTGKRGEEGGRPVETVKRRG